MPNRMRSLHHKIFLYLSNPNWQKNYKRWRRQECFFKIFESTPWCAGMVVVLKKGWKDPHLHRPQAAQPNCNKRTRSPSKGEWNISPTYQSLYRLKLECQQRTLPGPLVSVFMSPYNFHDTNGMFLFQQAPIWHFGCTRALSAINEWSLGRTLRCPVQMDDQCLEAARKHIGEAGATLNPSHCNSAKQRSHS